MGINVKALGIAALVAAGGAAAYFLGSSPNKEPGKGISPQDISSAVPQQDNTLLPTGEELPKELIKFIQEQRENDPLLKYGYRDIIKPITEQCMKEEKEDLELDVKLGLIKSYNKRDLIENTEICVEERIKKLRFLLDPTKPPTNYTGSLEDFKLPEDYKQIRKQIIGEWKKAENDLYKCVKKVVGEEKVLAVIWLKNIPPEVGGFNPEMEDAVYFYEFGEPLPGQKLPLSLDKILEENKCVNEYQRLENLTKKYGCPNGDYFSEYCLQRVVYEARKIISENPEEWRNMVPE